MISTIIFDMDGVIIDSEPLHKEIEMSVMQELGLSISEKEYQGFVGTTSKSMWSQIIDKYNLDIAVDEAIARSREKYFYYLHHTDQPRLVPGVLAFLNELNQHNIKILLASSSTQENINLVLNKHQIAGYFQHKVGGDQVENGKPDPEIFLLAAKEAKTLPSQCLVIEDSRNGVAAAKAAGMKCIGFKDPAHNQQLLYDADLVIDSMEKLSIPFITESLSKIKI